MPDTEPSPPASEPLPSWARPVPPALPGGRWLASARRWLLAERDVERDADAGGHVPPPSQSGAPAAVSTGPLLERLRRCVAHAVRHPGFGFALLHLELAPTVTGDRRVEAWRAVERRLGLGLRPGDALAPLAGPEPGFLMVLDGIADEADLHAIVQRMLAELSDMPGEAPLPPPLALRIGAVFAAPGQPSRPAEALLMQAQRALADATPGGWVLAAPGSAGADVRRHQPAATAGCLHVLFEPQVDLAGGGLVALEARLAVHALPASSRGSADAREEDARADRRLRQLLEQAAGAFLAWRGTVPSRAACRLAVAVPAALVRRAGWADELEQYLHGAGLAAADMQLELPPSLALHDRNLPPRLEALARLGCTLALDDFGTGHSSLSALPRLPLSLLKLHPGLVPQPHEREHHRVLLEATLRLASQLGLATLAKGLQTAAQPELLLGLGCQRGEGPAATALLPSGALAGLELAVASA